MAAEWVRALAWTGDRTVPGRVRIMLRQGLFGTLSIPFTPLWNCQCISEETLKAVCPFYLVSMPGEVKYPTSLHWKRVTVLDTPIHYKTPPCNKPHTFRDAVTGRNRRQDTEEDGKDSQMRRRRSCGQHLTRDKGKKRKRE